MAQNYMDEKILKLIAIITVIIGFSGLLLIAEFQSPEGITGKKEIPEDTTIRFNARIDKVRKTSEGSSIQLQRVVNERGFIDKKVPQEIVGSKATITGEVKDSFFSIEKIEVTNRFNESSE